MKSVDKHHSQDLEDYLVALYGEEYAKAFFAGEKNIENWEVKSNFNSINENNQEKLNRFDILDI